MFSLALSYTGRSSSAVTVVSLPFDPSPNPPAAIHATSDVLHYTCTYLLYMMLLLLPSCLVLHFLNKLYPSITTFQACLASQFLLASLVKSVLPSCVKSSSSSSLFPVACALVRKRTEPIDHSFLLLPHHLLLSLGRFLYNHPDFLCIADALVSDIWCIIVIWNTTSFPLGVNLKPSGAGLQDS